MVVLGMFLFGLMVFLLFSILLFISGSLGFLLFTELLKTFWKPAPEKTDSNNKKRTN